MDDVHHLGRRWSGPPWSAAVECLRESALVAPDHDDLVWADVASDLLRPRPSPASDFRASPPSQISGRFPFKLRLFIFFFPRRWMQLLVAAAPLRPCFYCAVVFPPASPAVQKLPSAGSLGIRVNKLRAIGRRRESRQRAKTKSKLTISGFSIAPRAILVSLFCSSRIGNGFLVGPRVC